MRPLRRLSPRAPRPDEIFKSVQFLFFKYNATANNELSLSFSFFVLEFWTRLNCKCQQSKCCQCKHSKHQMAHHFWSPTYTNISCAIVIFKVWIHSFSFSAAFITCFFRRVEFNLKNIKNDYDFLVFFSGWSKLFRKAWKKRGLNLSQIGRNCDIHDVSLFYIYLFHTKSIYHRPYFFSFSSKKILLRLLSRNQTRARLSAPTDFLQWTHCSMKKAVGAENEAIVDLLKQPLI